MSGSRSVQACHRLANLHQTLLLVLVEESFLDEVSLWAPRSVQGYPSEWDLNSNPSKKSMSRCTIIDRKGHAWPAIPPDEANLPGVGLGRGLFVGSALGSGVIFLVGSAHDTRLVENQCRDTSYG